MRFQVLLRQRSRLLDVIFLPLFFFLEEQAPTTVLNANPRHVMLFPRRLLIAA